MQTIFNFISTPESPSSLSTTSEKIQTFPGKAHTMRPRFLIALMLSVNGLAAAMPCCC